MDYIIYIVLPIGIAVLYTMHKIRQSQEAPITLTNPIPIVSQWAVEKARNNPNYIECLQEDICPACGNEGLNEEIYGTFDQYSKHHCTKCGFATSCEVLY